MGQSVAFFNNKGGVGKTTLSCNMASHIAVDTHSRVLVVDLDPQCNATQLLLEDAVWTRIYANRAASEKQTVLHALRHIRKGDSGIDSQIQTHRSPRFGVDVLAGHPNLSMIEDILSSSWSEFQGGTLGGARRSMWLRTLTQELEYDYYVFDLGPSLGALNRTVLLGTTFFMTPMSADLFSLYALDNISGWITDWMKKYSRALEAVLESNPDSSDLNLPEEPEIAHGYVGYTVQQYVTRNSGGELRAVSAYERYRKQIPARASALKSFASANVKDIDLGVVPNMFAMVPLAQAAHAPIRDLKAADGLRGSAPSQQARYVKQLNSIAARLKENLGI